VSAYYNEIDPHAAAWLRELIRQGHIAPGDVDERSIEDVLPADLAGYTQCHFFAGIGGWSYALDLAGWPRDRPVWTGSCPCQPFSAAGKGLGFADERHLWPAFFHLIRQCVPSVVLGEQVASRDGLAWWDLVSTDLEGSDYASAAADLCSASVTDAEIRQRLYWLAHAPGERYDRLHTLLRGLAGGRYSSAVLEATRRGEVGGMGDASGAGLAQRIGDGSIQREAMGAFAGKTVVGPSHLGRRPVEWVACTDGLARPIEPGSFPLVDDVPARVVRLRGYGNAINPEVAATFIRAYCEAVEEMTAAA
jgi:DNA (cytosine-5)-methyltransferase 1